MSVGGRIRDPVHGYVRFTRVERALIDDPLVQRLRYVGQAGLSHLVFPEVRSPRFSHSLGAMHLSSRFLATALKNTDPALRDRIEPLMDDAVNAATSGYLPSRSDIVDALTQDGLLAATSVSDQARASALLLEQGLRLAGLVHDLGHMPFSHDFEYALGQLLDDHREEAVSRFPALTEASDLAIHERIGYRLAQTLVHKVFGTVAGQFEGDLARSSFSVAERILLAEPPPAPALSVAQHQALTVEALWWWLHSLMAGEIDVDRCDYLLRDARNYGFEFASYDLDRLADHLTIVRPRPDRNLLETAVMPQGISAAESFYLARYRAYTWGPYHHKVSQVAAALQESIRTVLSPAFSPGGAGALSRFLEDLELVAADSQGRLHEHAPDLLERMRRYDDGWLMGYLRDAALSGRHPAQQPWLDLVCWRTPGPKSLWKRSADFPFSLPAFNAQLPAPDDPIASPRWRASVTQLATDEVLVIRHHFTPFAREPGSAHSRLKVSGTNGKLLPLTDISPMTASLPNLWKADLQVFAFSACDPSRVKARDVVRMLR